MTLQQLFDHLGQNPYIVWFYFLALPLTAAIAGFTGAGEGGESPWKYLYATLIYLACVPGIFAVALDVYFFLFERRSILQSDVFTQILPVVSMFATLFIIRRNVDFDLIPGFDKLSGLVTMIFGVIAFMWLLDKIHLIAFVSMSFYQLIAIFILFLLLLRWGWAKMF